MSRFAMEEKEEGSKMDYQPMMFDNMTKDVTVRAQSAKLALWYVIFNAGIRPDRNHTKNYDP